MLKLTIPEQEGFDDKKNEFITIPEQHLQLEHSLVSLTKWESKWNKPFLSTDVKTDEETLDYIRCMTLTQNVNPILFNYFPPEAILAIKEYIEAPMTATTIHDNSSNRNKEIITSEIIYYWMISLNIPFECQKWHLNRLLTLIRVCSIKNGGSKPMSNKEILNQNRALNAARRAKYHTKG